MTNDTRRTPGSGEPADASSAPAGNGAAGARDAEASVAPPSPLTTDRTIDVSMPQFYAVAGLSATTIRPTTDVLTDRLPQGTASEEGRPPEPPHLEPPHLETPPADLPAAARDPYLRFVHALASHGADGPDALKALTAAAPDHALPPALSGLALMTLGRRETLEAAAAAHAESLKRARASGTGAPVHADLATALRDALGDWLAGQPCRGADRLDAHVASDPTCLLAIKLSHAIRFMAGDRQGMRSAIVRARAGFSSDGPAAGYVAGCHAFALEETGALADAEQAGRTAVALAPDDAWGLHAVAHVFETRVAPHDGLAWLEGRRERVAHCNNFRFHVAWHEALFALELGAIDRVLALYDEEIRAVRSDDFRDVANAVSLLTRLALDGVPVGDRFEELADIAEKRIGDGALAFADLHNALALAGAGRLTAGDRLASRLETVAAGPCDADGRAVAEVAAPAGRAIALFARGQSAAAFRRLSAALDNLVGIGGSNAQRDVFVRLAIEAAVRAGERSTAETLIQRRAGATGRLDRFGQERLVRLATHDRQLKAPLEALSG